MKLKNQDRTYGVEIEMMVPCNGVELANKLQQAGLTASFEGYTHRITRYWKVVTDGSISGSIPAGYFAYELVSPILKGDAGLEEIRKVCEVLASLNAKVNKSCGLHIHHKSDGIGRARMINLVNFYKKAEAQLDKMMAPSRRTGNRYCRTMKDHTPYSDRYFKVNLRSYQLYGTIEFRHHHGTVEFEKISNWIDLTQRIMERCRRKVTAYRGHDLTWFDVKQALGLVHNAGERENELVTYCERRMATLERRAGL